MSEFQLIAPLPTEIDKTVAHVAGPPEAYGGKFRSACRCGYPGKDGGTPSHAYNATKVHADTENRREAGGGLPGAGGVLPAPRTGAVARASRSPRPASGGGPCGCGCGEQCGGRFRPGHDSKLLSRLQTEVQSGAKSKDDALAELASHPKLQTKLAGRLA